jgi:hypothetical protein
MTKLTMISTQEGRCGFREDDWQIIRTINNEDEFLKALKEGYLKDASNRNNYPITSHEIGRDYTFEDLSKYEGYTWLGNPNYYDNDEDEDFIPNFKYHHFNDIDLSEYKKIFDKFEKWKSKIKSLLPILKEKARKIEKEKADIKNLFRLAEKYNYKLTKDK